MKVNSRVFRFTKSHPGLVLLLSILTVISVQTIKPGYYLIGWDNYSSYFNLPTNLFRTFFATWRDYRGLGVPSDSEIVDLFRQLFFFVLQPIVSAQLLDQLYFVLSLSIGTAGMYVFAWLFLHKTGICKELKKLDIAASTASFFYLFNLNTLGTFFFPIVTYITRFAALPVLFLFFFLLTHEKKITKKMLVLAFFCFLFASGSYITATIFITSMLSLGIFSLFQGSIKSIAVIFLMFLGINFFWITPFINYTIQKTPIIRLAPTFIDANEAQLNKPASFYRLDKQMILLPNFFETTFKESATGQDRFFHPLSHNHTFLPVQLILFIFPILYVFGSLLIFVKFKRHRAFLWIPITIALYLFLTMKEYSPLGNLYKFLDTWIPYFGVLFRFGDTKFHPYFAFAGSISASVAIVSLLSLVRSRLRLFLAIFMLTGTFGATVFVYKDYFNGNLIGFFEYNKIPTAYSQIAKEINTDPRFVRVLHLPFDRNAYWKSYTWGAIGSSFFHYMINKPLIEKTFEPGSMENASLDRQLSALLENIQQIESQGELSKRALAFYQLLRQTGIGYIVLDQTVSADVFSRGILYWGNFNYKDARRMVDLLIRLHFAERIKKAEVRNIDYSSIYPDKFPLSEATQTVYDNKKALAIDLIKIKDPEGAISFLSSVESLDPMVQDNTLGLIKSGHFIQDRTAHTTLFPFYRRDATIRETNQEILYTLPNSLTSGRTYTLRSSGEAQSTARQLAISASRNDKEIVFTFSERLFPTINGQEFLQNLDDINVPLNQLKLVDQADENSAFFSNWHVINAASFLPIRLRIGNTVLPVPSDLPSSERYIADVFVTGTDVPMEILTKSSTQFLQAFSFKPTDDPNCFKDKLADYSYSITQGENLGIRSRNGSTCMQRSLSDVFSKGAAYAEVRLKLSGSQEDLDSIPTSEIAQSIKPQLKKIVLSSPKPNYVRLCVQESAIGECFNTHTVFSVGQASNIIVPLERPIAGVSNPVALLSVKNVANQLQDVQFSNMWVDSYAVVGKKQISLPSSGSVSPSVNIAQDQKIQVRLPKTLSPNAFYQGHHDGYVLSSKPCEGKQSYRTYRLIKGQFVSYVDNCDNQVAHELPFASEKFLFWSVSYNLLSGRFPKFILKDRLTNYIDEYLSLYQGYPDIQGFKMFQSPELPIWFRTEDIGTRIQTMSYSTAYTFIDPQPELSDHRPKQFMIHQNSENEGVMAIKAFDLIDLPKAWKNFSITSSETKQDYAVPLSNSYKKILPSLWKVTVEAGDGDQKMLLKFNEGFDTQWRLYKSAADIILARKGGVKPIRCDGYANCFGVEGIQEGKQNFYIFYTPERLSLLGWVVTVAAVVFGWKYFSKRS